MFLRRPTRSGFLFAGVAAGGGGAADSNVNANTDFFRLPTEDEARERDLAHESAVALSVATLILVASDVLWGVLGLVLLSNFRWAILGFLAVDLTLLLASRRTTFLRRALVVARGGAGVVWFTGEAFLFGESAAYSLGQWVLLAALVLLVVGRGGDGKIMAGIVVAVISLALTFSIAFAQMQGKVNDLNREIAAAFELASVGRAGEAVERMELLVELNPDDAWVHMAAAELYRSDTIRDLNRAVFLADIAVKLADDDLKASAYVVLATIQEMRGEARKAIDSATNSIKAEGKNPLAYMIRARLYAVTERRVEAIEDLRKVEELAPGSDIAQNARLARLQMQGDGPVRVTGPDN